jgi:predicted N-acetyltransferase YhbS
MIKVRKEKTSEAPAREALLDEAYGAARFEKPSQRLRGQRSPALSLVAIDDEGIVIGTVRMWDVTAGPNRPALLLGPLAVKPSHRRRGIGTDLMRHALRIARRRGHKAVLLVGDLAYYGRFGFSADRTARLWLPGLHDRTRLLGCELVAGALDGAYGTVAAPKEPPRTRLIDAVAVFGAPLKPKAA